MKNKLKIVDSAFSHQTHSCFGRKSDNIIWDRNFSDQYKGNIFFTDYDMGRAYRFKHSNNIAWLVEPSSINGNMYETFRNQTNLPFSLILSSDLNFVKEIDKKIPAEWVPVGGCWLKDNDCKIYEKTKNISIIASKKMITDGHKLRHIIINSYKEIKENAYGNGYLEIPYKLEGLKDYRFQIVVENARINGYFTEKIIDCFAAGVIPIYWGSPNISDYFNDDSIFSFSNIHELDDILKKIQADPISLYSTKLVSIEENFNISKEYYLVEDWIFKNKKWIFDE